MLTLICAPVLMEKSMSCTHLVPDGPGDGFASLPQVCSQGHASSSVHCIADILVLSVEAVHLSDTFMSHLPPASCMHAGSTTDQGEHLGPFTLKFMIGMGMMQPA